MKPENINMHLMLRVANEKERIIEGYASTANQARDKLTIDPEAWRATMEEYMRAPAVLYEHGVDPTVGRNPVGQVLFWSIDATGLFVRAQIGKGIDYIENRIWPLIQQGLLRAFSVHAPYSSIKQVGDRITAITLYELSIVSVPADVYATFSLARAMNTGSDFAPVAIQEAIGTLEAKISDVLSAKARAAIRQAIQMLQDLVWQADNQDMRATEEKAREITNQVLAEVTDMEPKELEAMIRAQVADGLKAGMVEFGGMVRSTIDARETELAVKAKADADAAAALERTVQERVTAELAKAQPALQRKQVWGGAATPAGDAGKDKKAEVQVYSRYDEIDPGDLAMAHGMMTLRGIQPKDPEAMLRSMACRALDAIGRGTMRRDALGDLPFKRSGEVMGSTVSSYGDEWVPTLWSTQLWEKMRLENVVANLFPQIEMPSNPYIAPFEGADPTVYFIGETVDQTTTALTAAVTTTSKVGTGQTTFTAKKLSALVVFAGELVEDSILAMIPQLRKQMSLALSAAVDNVVVNGDTVATTANINCKTSGGTGPGATHKTSAFNGLRKWCLITNTAQKRDGATIALADFTATRKLLGKYGVKVTDLAYLMDMETYYAALANISELMTLEKYGPAATVLTGEMAKVGGVPALVSAEIPLADTTGSVDGDTAGNNTKGTLMAIYKPGFAVGWRRHITLEQERIPFSDAWYLVGSVRVCLTPWSTAETNMLGLSYNCSQA